MFKDEIANYKVDIRRKKILKINLKIQKNKIETSFSYKKLKKCV